jgi:phosphatidylinositol dimannoside acyltransferase
VTIAYLIAWRVVRLLPERVAHAIFRFAADRITRRDGRGVRQLRQNLEAVGPVDGVLMRQAVRSYLRYWCEAFRLPSWPIEDVVARTRLVNEATLRAAFADRGAVLALPHQGNWDWAGAWATATGMPVVSVAERLKPEQMYERFLDFRRSLGMEILPVDGPDTLDRLEGYVAQRKLVCLLSDRDLSRSAVDVTLLGRPARMPRGPAVLALRTGAALIPVTGAYDGREMVLTIHPPVPASTPEQMMQTVADAFTEAIRAAPQDWHMMQRVFGEAA